MTHKGFYDPSGKIEHGGTVLCTVLEKQPGGYAIEFGRNGMRGLLLTRDVVKQRSRLSVQFDSFQSGLAVFHCLSQDVESALIEEARERQIQSGGYTQQWQSAQYPEQSQSGGYSQDEHSAGYFEQRRSCRYSQNQSGGYPQQQRSSGGYPQQQQSGGYPQPQQSGDYEQSNVSQTASGAFRQRREIGVYRRPRPSVQHANEKTISRSKDSYLDEHEDDYSDDSRSPHSPPRSRFSNLHPDNEGGLVQSFLSSLRQALWPMTQA